MTMPSGNSNAAASPRFTIGDIGRTASPDPQAELLGIHRGQASSPAPSFASSSGRRTPSKRELIRAKNPPPHHVSKLEDVLGGKGKAKAASNNSHVVNTDAGILKDELYDEYLPPVIASIRRALIWSLRKETEWLAWHQPLVRTPYLDRYFVWTSLFGSHSFYLAFLPACFWFSSRFMGRGLVNTLAFGVYFSSALKDLLCVPRPYSPPVTRLTVGSIHLEYGFPSTHSTNGVGTALYVYFWVLAFRELNPQGYAQSYWWEAGLLFYVLSIVYGRIYAGMHSIMDCFAGSVLGAGLTLIQWYGAEHWERFLGIQGWTVPAILIPACLFMVYVHPEPLDDCPCFEDAIAFISVVLGVSLGRWASLHWNLLTGLDTEDPLSLQSKQLADVTPDLAIDKQAQRLLRQFVGFIVGVLVIFTVRAIVKTVSKVVLPPLFRLVDRTFGLVLPRRHYTNSSDYQSVPMEGIIRAPSVLNFPDTLHPKAAQSQQSPRGGVRSDQQRASGSSLASGIQSHSTNDLRTRTSGSRDSALSELLGSPSRPLSPSYSPYLSINSAARQVQVGPNLKVPVTRPVSQGGPELPGDKVANQLAASLSKEAKQRQQALEDGDVKHYDIDVLTKFLVYSNIGFFAACMIPMLLAYLGLSE